MANNIREYQNLKLFRGSKRNNDKLLRLAEVGRDFEYRRLLIEENELDLHVYFSRMTIGNWLAWCSILLALSFWQHPIMATAFIGLAIVLKICSWQYMKKFELVLRSYSMVLKMVNIVIAREIGSSIY